MAREFSDFRYGRVHRLTVDTYSLQHPDRYMRSARSFAAHLTGMCVFMEHGGDRELLRLLQRWLNGKRVVEKPPLPEAVGELTIAHLIEAQSPEQHRRRVYEWAEDVWQAYAACHTLASEWIAAARRGR